MSYFCGKCRDVGDCSCDCHINSSITWKHNDHTTTKTKGEYSYWKNQRNFIKRFGLLQYLWFKIRLK